MGGVSQAWAEAGQQAEERRQQRNAIQEQQRVQQQNTVGAQLLDAINQSSNIKPTMKDEQGNVVDNPAYAQAQIDRRNLLAQYTALNSPEQHASFGQRLHGLIFGHPTDQKREPALSPAGAETPQPPAAASLMAPNAAPPAPQHPMAAPNPETEAMLAKGQGFMDKLKNHMAAFAHPLPAQPKPDVALMAKYYRDPAEVAHERQMEMWGLRGENALAVAQERTKALMASMAARPPRQLSQTTIPDFLEQIKVDPELATSMYGPDGRPITVAQISEMPQNFVVREFRAGPNVFYAFSDQNSKTLNVGGQIFDIPQIGPITAQNSTAIGAATSTLPKNSVQTDQYGNVITTQRTTPTTPGMSAASATPAGPASTNTPP